MDPARWQQIQSVYFEAADLAPEARTAFLDSACAGDAALREEVASLLEAEAPALFSASLDDLSTLVDDPPEASGAPERIGAYRVIRQIGRGGMGTVYLAERADGAYQQQVAVKMIRRGLDTEDLLRRFVTERQILASLSHPNIARLLDGGQHNDGRAYLVLEYVDGVAITDYCQTHELSLDDRLQLFQTVCMAVHAAHQNFVVHRDLKPDNILVTEAGEVKLLDFGIAKLLDTETSPFTAALTQHNQRILTPGYAAPEQLRGGAITTGTDVYSLGVVLYELLTGQRPHRLAGVPPHEAEHIVCTVTAPAPSTRIGEASGAPEAQHLRADQLQKRLKAGLDDIALFALRKEPEHRYASAQDLATDVGNYLAGRPLAARTDHWSYRARLFTRRNRVSVGIAAVAVLALLGGFGTAVWQARVANQERAVATLEAERARTVRDFLAQSFRASTPTAARIDTLTVSEWLEASVQQIDDSFSDQPDLHAEMLNTVGDVYTSLGRFDDAFVLIERAHAIAVRTAPPGSGARALADYHLGRIYHRLDRYEAADSLFALSIQQYESIGDADQAALARLERARTLIRLDSSDLGHSLLSANEAYYLSQDPVPLTEYTNTLILRGHTYRIEDEYDRAIETLSEAIRIRREIGPSVREKLADDLYGLALLYIEEKRDLDTAERLYRESHEICNRIYPEGHYKTVMNLHTLAKITWIRGDFRSAEAMFREAIAVDKAQYPEGHFRIAEGLLRLGEMLHAQSRFDEALQTYRESYENYRLSRGEDYGPTRDARRGMAAILDSLGRSQEAARYRRPEVDKPGQSPLSDLDDLRMAVGTLPRR